LSWRSRDARNYRKHGRRELRAKTDAPMMECKKALTEADGDMERAEEILRVKLGSKAGKASSRITAEGVVAAAGAGSTAALVEVNCETDFVSKNDDFLAFAQAWPPGRGQRNPADVAALAALPLTQDGFGPRGRRAQGPDRQDRREHVVRRFKRYAGGGKLARYLHGTRIGVLVEFDGDDVVAAKDVAMHVAAMKPAALSAADVPAELVDKERKIAIAAEKAAESGKPAEIVAKMVEGSVQKYLKEVSLLDQVFVKAADGKQSVGRCSRTPRPR
jgi:elongation factor Ts